MFGWLAAGGSDADAGDESTAAAGSSSPSTGTARLPTVLLAFSQFHLISSILLLILESVRS